MPKTISLLLPLGLALIPIVVWRWSQQHARGRRFALTGLAWGVIAAPFSLALYGFFFISAVTAPAGIVGLVLSMIHSAPGYEVGAMLGLHDGHTVIRGFLLAEVTALNGVIWAAVYGLIGAGIDLLSNIR